MSAPLLPAGVGITDLRVYDWPAADGLAGGSPHLHTLCTEAYCVVAGTGAVQTLGPDAVVRETPLAPGGLVWFSPGIIHRLINASGNLRILVVMQNGGLPEAGDFILTFTRRILSNDAEYAVAASISPAGRVDAATPEAARRRRDLAVEGFRELAADAKARGPEAMRDFYALAAGRARAKVPDWRAVWEAGARAAADATGEHLAALAAGDPAHLMDAALAALRPDPRERLGMCGRLSAWLPEGMPA